ncbi:hypothetical protein NE237_008256 [Protea cynaroides]|uniref:Uncharacterized protein n=1 Tax=Protea cynaroides TaxID=273540 RepID=A0A9Q0JTK3_9MAGN|nr:hypothetical protein NE237_008256 [Protea cynaroides]
MLLPMPSEQVATVAEQQTATGEEGNQVTTVRGLRTDFPPLEQEQNHQETYQIHREAYQIQGRNQIALERKLTISY